MRVSPRGAPMVSQKLLVAICIAVLTEPVAGQDRAEELRKAVRDGNIERVRTLLDAGADVNSTVENGFTPIYFAENPKIVDLLIARGAKLDLRDRASLRTPLERAAKNYFDRDDTRETRRAIVAKLRAAGAEYTIDAAIYMDDVGW